MTTVRVMNHPFQNTRQGVRTGHLVEVLPPVEVSTERLGFRPLVLADRPRVLDALARTREQLHRCLPLNRTDANGRTESDSEMFTRWVETAIESDNNRSAWRRAAFLEDGSFVGCFNLIKIERGLEWACEANYWVDAALQGQGYAREGVEAMLSFATADLPVGLGLHRVTAMVQPDNAPSLRLLGGLGFREADGSELLDINGVPRTHFRYTHTLG